jgi:ABC-type antimicrobial peptide transport system permease subunit
MSSHGRGFPINDLTRRRLPTALTVATLTLSVASTLFLLFFSSRLGIGIFSESNTLTLGLTAVLGQFVIFIGVLIFAVGAILTSFIVFLMMAQRTRDFGLIKAAGCPNNLAAGYFLTELLTVTLVSCVLGVAFGFLADFAAATMVFSGYSLPNLWFAPLVFVVFFVLAFIFGLQPLLKAAKMSAVEALSPVTYYGSIAEGTHKALSHSALTWRIATRSLARRISATFRVTILLVVVFVLLTVSVAGGIIAKDTTTQWATQPLSGDVVAIAVPAMGSQYEVVLSSFSGEKVGDFDYADPNLAVPENVTAQVAALSCVETVDARLILHGTIHEISNFTINPETLATLPVGDNRSGEALIVGVNPQQTISSWSLKGRFLGENGSYEAVIGDSISQSMYYPNPSRFVVLSDPLLEGFSFNDTGFHIVGVCVDPLNSGYVAYVPLDNLKNASSIQSPNLVLTKLDAAVDRNEAITQIRNTVKAVDGRLEVFDLSAVMTQNRAFLAATWQTIMLLPLLSLASAAMCLVGYMMLSVAEQRQEFGMLRAVGAKPRIIINTCAIQSGVVLLGSFGLGLSFGVIITVLILMANPLVTVTSVLVIAAYLSSALIAMFLFSLYPAVKLAKTAILRIMA